jgi:DNA-binding NarL/FixJ family response regulator
MASPEELDEAAVLELVERVAPQIVLLDLHLGSAGLATPLIGPIIEMGALVLMLTSSQDGVLLARCLEAGAVGVFDKAEAFDTLLVCVEDVALGRTTMRPAARDALLAQADEDRQQTDQFRATFERLTRRERQVLAAAIDGASAEEIAVAHHVAISTVRSHIRSVLEKLGVNSQLAAVALARRADWSGGTDASA